VKIIGQLAISIALVLYLFGTRHDLTTNLYVPFFKYPVLDLEVVYIPFAVVLLVGTSNAVNLTDGLDGLAAGVSLIALVTFSVLAYQQQDWMTFGICLAFIGAILGFLFFNNSMFSLTSSLEICRQGTFPVPECL